MRIPYLNGGLFEENPAEKPFRSFDFPAKLFQELFAFFARFNFTIDESDPIDIEIGVDPEMLGRIFEALLEDNKEKGAYYTPKAIVAYMCQEALIRHLHTHLTPAATAADLETVAAWIRSPDKSLAPVSFVKSHASCVDHLLRDIKICDPAIGSGAFPMGMLQEIIRARLALNPKLDPAALKAHTIQNSIYGVDLDSGAVDIARLRFWLSLVVDEHEPRPLPNLDYKIMQGNSLLESFEGVDLSRIHTPETVSVKLVSEPQAKPTEFGFITEVDRTLRFEEQILTLNKSTVETLDALIKAYFSESDPDRKHTQRQEIDSKVRAHIADNFKIDQENVRAAIDFTKDKIAEKKRLHHPLKSEERTLETLKTRLSELERAHKQLNHLDEFSDRPYFLWHLFFHDVFAAGGFDVVIGNPPYVRQETIKDAKPALKAEGYKCFDGVADLLVYFYERGVTLLRDGGAIALITSNKFYRAGYGEKLREYLARELTLHNLIDFGDAPVFDAIAYASILTGTRTAPEQENSAHAYTWEKGVSVDNIATIVAERGQTIRQVELKSDGWRLEKPAVLKLLAKMRKAGKPLGEYVGNRFYRGILTGLNEAFVVDRATRDRLITEHKSSAEVLKPFLRGRDVKRWHVEKKRDSWIIFTRRGIEIEKYPAIYKYLLPFKKQLMPGTPDGRKPGNYAWYEIQDNIAYWQEFSTLKIVYPDIAPRCAFALDDVGLFPDCTLFLIPGTTKWLLALLNSQVISFFFPKICPQIRGAFMRFKSIYMEQIPIPAATPQQQADITAIVDRILATKAVNSAADVSALESQIDRLVYALYDLTPEEIALVEGTPEATSTVTLDMFPVGLERFVAEIAIRVAIRYPGLQVNDYANAVGLLFSAGDGLTTYIVGDPQKTAWLTVWKKVAKGRSFLKGAGVPNIAQLTADLRKSGFFKESTDTAECQLTTPLEPDATLDAIVPFVHVAWLNHRKLVAPPKTGTKDAVQAIEGELVLRGGGNAHA